MRGIEAQDYNDLCDWYSKMLNKDEQECFRRNLQSHPEECQRSVMEYYYDFIAKTRCVWCWFKSEHESATMWGNYGKCGVAIRSNRERLMHALRNSGQKWFVSSVDYEDFSLFDWETYFHRRNGRWWTRRPFLLKGIEYQSENEVRFVTADHYPSVGLELNNVLPEEWMIEIRLWPGLPKSTRDAIKAAVVKCCPALTNRFKGSTIYELGYDTIESDCLSVDKEQFCGFFYRNMHDQLPNLLRNP
jgi:hypothetical protein